MLDTTSSADIPAPSAKRSTRISSVSDERLARDAGRGDQRAFAAIYERYHQPLYGYCRSLLRTDFDAQDALQSTFVNALSALQRRQRGAPLRPWLFRIAHNEAVTIIRRRGRDTEQVLSQTGPLVHPSAEDQAAERARWALLTADLAELPQRLQGALLLRELSGLSHQEIATTFGTTVGGAKQAIFEARQALTEFADGREMECEQVCKLISGQDGRMLRGRRVQAHLRCCRGCAGFAEAIPARRAQLRTFTPVLPAIAAAALLSHVSRAATGPGAAAASTGSAASSAATMSAVGKTAGSFVAWKTITAGAVAVVTAVAGVAGLAHVLHHRPADRPAVTRGVSPSRPEPEPASVGSSALGASAAHAPAAAMSARHRALRPRASVGSGAPASGPRKRGGAARRRKPAANPRSRSSGHAASSGGPRHLASGPAASDGGAGAPPGQIGKSPAPGRGGAPPGQIGKSPAPGRGGAPPGQIGKSPAPGRGGAPPGQIGKSPAPGRGGAPPGQIGKSPAPGRGGAPPGQIGKSPAPGRGGAPPGQIGKSPAPGRGGAPPGQIGKSPAPGRAGAPPGQIGKSPAPGRAGTPPDQIGKPAATPGKAAKS